MKPDLISRRNFLAAAGAHSELFWRRPVPPVLPLP